MQRYDSRFCTFAVPDDWQPQPPFGYVEPGEEEELMAAQAYEQWLETAQSASQLATEERENLPHLFDGFELLGDGPLRTQAGQGEGHALEYRYLNEDQEGVLVKKIFLTQGPLSVRFELTRSVDGDDEKRARLAEQIASTLSLRDTDFLSRHQPLVLLTGDSGAESRSAPSVEIPPNAPRQDFPRCCVSLPELAGWPLEPGVGAAARYTSSRFTITLERPIGQENDAEAWLGERMAAMQAAKTPVLGSGRGELPPDGVPWSALHFEQQGELRWNTAATPVLLQVYVEDRQPLLWSLSGPRSGFDEPIPALEALIRSATFLEPERWETPLAEPWIDAVLIGPWTSEGPDLYFESGRKVILQTNTESSPVPLANVRPSIIDSVKSNVDVERDFTEDALDGKLQGAPSLRYALDGENHYGEPVSLRTLWSTRDETLYSLVVLTRDPQLAQESFEQVASGVDFGRARR